MVAFMVFSPGRWVAVFGCAMIIASQQTAVVIADTHFPPLPAGISPSRLTGVGSADIRSTLPPIHPPHRRGAN
jgi:hypothetical protein